MTDGDVRMTTGTFLARGVSSVVVREMTKVTDGDAPFAKELQRVDSRGRTKTTKELTVGDAPFSKELPRLSTLLLPYVIILK